MELLNPRVEFSAIHPYKPYDIQIAFMRHLYTAIRNKKIAILESPTGTVRSLSCMFMNLAWNRDVTSCRLQGKTLSIICGAFQWLAEMIEDGDDGMPSEPTATSDAPADGMCAFDGDSDGRF